MKHEDIQVATPFFLGAIGLLIVLAIIFSKQSSDVRCVAEIGLDGTAIVGASAASLNSRY